MALPALVSLDDFALRAGGVAAADEDRAQAALADASALIRAEAGTTWTDDHDDLDGVPDVIVAICVAVALRAWLNPDGARSEQIGNYAVTWADSSTGVYLSAGERRTIRRAAARPAIGAVTLESPYTRPFAGTEWADVDDGGDPIPWRMKEDL